MTGTFLLLLLLCFTPPFDAAGTTYDDYVPICNASSNYTANSTYLANINLLSSMLIKNTTANPSPYAKGSVGAVPDAVYGLFLCQGDVGAFDCSQCAATGFHAAQQLCAFNKEMTVISTRCLVHISNQDFLDRVSSLAERDYIVLDSPDWDWNGKSTKAVAVVAEIKVLVQETARHAAYNSTWRYATGRMAANSIFRLPLYSQAQCIPELTPDECWGCLNNTSNTALLEEMPVPPGSAFTVACNWRYSVDKFYEEEPLWRIMSPLDAAAPAPPVAMPKTSARHKRDMRKILVIALSIPLLATTFCFTLYFKFVRRHIKDSQDKDKVNLMQDEALVLGLEGRSSEFTVYEFSQVLEATSNFSEENKLGQGGFGPVYKGQFPDGLEVAVKRLASHSGQGFTEFKNEILLIAKLQHTNLVRLLGCSTQGEEKTLVYEYLPNKSLDSFIFDETRRASLDWSRRLAIIEGIAQGLVYLHKHSRLRVIHRDLKTSNILLDQEMNPKISDFGLAKIFSTNDTEGNTRRVVGTYGYMAPEYASEGLFSIKSDVFSFGVLVLEIISGKRTSSFHGYGEFINLLGYAWQLWKDGLWLQLVDTSLVTEVHTLEMMRCINIALLCVQENAADRPTMSHVVSMLSSDSMTLPQPNHPAYFHVRVTTEQVSTVVEPSSHNDVTVSALNGR